MSHRLHHGRRRALELSGATPASRARAHELEVSGHAIDRYVERIDPRASAEQAEAAIRAGMVGARRVHRQGRDRWFYEAGGEWRFRLVVREEPGRPRGVMTVLPLRDEDLADDCNDEEGTGDAQ